MYVNDMYMYIHIYIYIYTHNHKLTRLAETRLAQKAIHYIDLA